MAEVEVDERGRQLFDVTAGDDVEHVVAREAALGRVNPNVIRVRVLGGGVAVVEQHGDGNLALVEHGDGVVGAGVGLDDVGLELRQLGEDRLVILARGQAEGLGGRVIEHRAGGRGHVRDGDGILQLRVPQVGNALDLHVAVRAVIDDAQTVEGVGRAVRLAHRRAGARIERVQIGQRAGIEGVDDARVHQLLDEHVADDHDVIGVRGLDDLGHALRVAAGVHDERRAGLLHERIVDVLLQQLRVEAEGADGQGLAGEGLVLGHAAHGDAQHEHEHHGKGNELLHDVFLLFVSR